MNPHPIRIAAAAALYFATAFAVGFALGAPRVALLEPRIGPVPATLLELPVMLAASWMLSRWTIRLCRVPEHALARLAMGASALALLLCAEFVVARLLADRTLNEFIGGYARLEARLGLAAQVAFALFPWLQSRIRKQ